MSKRTRRGERQRQEDSAQRAVCHTRVYPSHNTLTPDTHSLIGVLLAPQPSCLELFQCNLPSDTTLHTSAQSHLDSHAGLQIEPCCRGCVPGWLDCQATSATDGRHQQAGSFQQQGKHVQQVRGLVLYRACMPSVSSAAVHPSPPTMPRVPVQQPGCAAASCRAICEPGRGPLCHAAGLCGQVRSS